jgi:hypothetical protein
MKPRVTGQNGHETGFVKPGSDVQQANYLDISGAVIGPGPGLVMKNALATAEKAEYARREDQPDLEVAFSACWNRVSSVSV